MKTLAIPAILLLLFFQACKKSTADDPANPAAPSGFNYGNTVFFLKVSDYTVPPVPERSGNYEAFPDDLNINNTTGVITVSLKGKAGKATQTGLKYQIVYTAASGKKDTSYITIAGINYQDRIYHLSQHDTLVRPIYNSSLANAIPAGNYTCSNNKVHIDPATGTINLKRSLIKGLFNDNPENDDWKVVNVKYTTQDGSTSDKNNLDVVIYYYTSVDHIPSNISTVMREHQKLLLDIPPVNIPVTNAPEDDAIKNIVSLSKPRPPCIIIIGN